MRYFLFAAAGLLLGACATSAPDAPSPPPPPPSAAITADGIAAHVATLSSDAFEGRAPASPGETKTLDYLTEAFTRLGLKPGPSGWLQPARLVSAEVTNKPALNIRGRDGTKTYAYRDAQVIWTKRVEPSVSLKDAELVFVGYGVAAPEKNWNDYAGANLKGKVAVILVNDPDYETAADHPTTGKFDGKAMTWYGRWPYKFEEAARQGAAGALIIHETGPAAYPFAVVQSSWTGPQFDTVRPDKGASRVALEGWVSTATAADLFKRAGLNFAELKAKAQTGGMKPVPMGLRLTATVEQTARETVSNNFIAMLPGTERPDEVVLYTAHHDHLGRCPAVDGDDLCNGAVDNATGLAGMIEIAKAHAKAGPARRTIAFVGFAAEEQGLLGSAFYADNPVFPLAKTVAGVNMDGASPYGPAREITVIGAGKSSLEELLAAAASTQGRRVSPEAFPERGGFYRSDHFSLAKVGVPMLFTSPGIDLVDGGVERGRAMAEDYLAHRYHKPDDEYDPSWNLEGAAQDARLLYEVGRQIADSDLWPQWAANSEFAAARAASLSK
jgi:Zn-dependent M28 family amino/carboxypeptidase